MDEDDLARYERASVRYRSGYQNETVEYFAGGAIEGEHVGALGHAFGVPMPDGSMLIGTVGFGVPLPDQRWAPFELVGFARGFSDRLVGALIELAWSFQHVGQAPKPGQGVRLPSSDRDTEFFVLDGGTHSFETAVPRLLVVLATKDEYTRWEQNGEPVADILQAGPSQLPTKRLPHHVVDRWSTE